VQFFKPDNQEKPEIHGGFALSHWSEGTDVLEKLKSLKVTARCIPIDGPDEEGICIFSGRKSRKRVLFAKNY
jgi:prolyl-tRNA synthetase